MKKITSLFLCLLFWVGFTTIKAQTRNTLGFDATDATSLVDCGASASYSPAVFTAEAWVNIYAGGGLATLMSNVEGGADTKGFTIRLGGGTGQKAELVMAIGAAAGYWFVLTATDDLPLNTWTHVAATYDGSNAEIFYNGVSEGTSANSNPMFVSAQNFYLGEHPTYPGRRLSGQLSDVRIWNVARTAGEIQASMNNFLTGTETGLVANWKLDEGFGTAINEQVTGSSTATAGAGTTWQLNTSLSVNDDLLQKSFSIYPNPSNGVFKVKSSVNETVDYDIYNITGKLVKTGTLSKIVDSIDLSDNSKGLYVLKGSLRGGHFIKKLVVN